MSGMKTSELTGAQLDAWVATAAGLVIGHLPYLPSTEWADGGPLIEREGIHVAPMPGKGSTWCAIALGRVHERAGGGRGKWMEGPTSLIAAMRAYVASKFGEEVPDLPK